MKETLYAAADTPELVNVPDGTYLMINGHGTPTSPAFQDAIQSLYSLAYPLKFAFKKQGVDYKVPPLEGLWWATGRKEFPANQPELWSWTLMIRQPEPVTKPMWENVLKDAKRKRPHLPYDRVHMKRFHEGTCVQIMHRGPYAQEEETIKKMVEWAGEHHYRLAGRHHEIYLGDPRRSKPENLKTVLRHPVAV